MAQGYPDYTLELAGVVQVANGGTGLTTFTAGKILTGNGINPMIPTNSLPELFLGPAGGAALEIVGAGSQSESGYIEFLDSSLGAVAYMELCSAVDALGFGEQLFDLLIGNTSGRVVIAQTVTGPQLILDSGGLELSGVGKINGLATVGQGVPVIIASVRSAGLSGSTALLTLLTSASAALYRVTCTLDIDAVGTWASGDIAIEFTDIAGTAERVNPATSAVGVAAWAAGGCFSGCALLDCKAGTAIQYQLNLAGGAGGSFTIVLVLERLS